MRACVAVSVVLIGILGMSTAVAQTPSETPAIKLAPNLAPEDFAMALVARWESDYLRPDKANILSAVFRTDRTCTIKIKDGAAEKEYSGQYRIEFSPRQTPEGRTVATIIVEGKEERLELSRVHFDLHNGVPASRGLLLRMDEEPYGALSRVFEPNESADTPSLVWRDATSMDVLFTSHDIYSFDWDKQMLLLKPEAMMDFLAWIPSHMHAARKLVIEDAKGIVYEAWWVSPVSSRGFFGPVYEPLFSKPIIAVRNGYPGRATNRPAEEDNRFSPRLKVGLEEAGVLGSIDVNKEYVGLAIQTVGQMWRTIGQDMKIRVEYFENTFRIGQKARAHIFFAGDKNTLGRIDSLAVEVKFVASDGRFQSKTIIQDIPLSSVESGIYVLRFDPWQPDVGSEKNPEQGTGVVSLSVLLKKGSGENRTIENRLDFPGSTVPIGGPTSIPR